MSLPSGFGVSKQGPIRAPCSLTQIDGHGVATHAKTVP